MTPNIDVATLIGLNAEDRRAIILRAEMERAESRRMLRIAQSAPSAPARERIRIWEELHGLNLPRDSEHKLVRIIARDTALTLDEVRGEQSRRLHEGTQP
jgi:hypothetical protein